MRLRELDDGDLDALFEQQADPESYLLADVPTRDRVAFDAHWTTIRKDPEVLLRVIEAEGVTAGHVVSFIRDGQREIGYWVDRDLWGSGIASEALRLFLEVEPRRPLHAKVAFGNPASVRVLEKHGFRKVRDLPDGYAFELT